MASTMETSKTFRIVAVLTIVLLAGAAGFFFMQASGGGDSSGELAALSQSLPRQASAAVDGSGSFETLADSTQRLAQLRRSAGPAVPGSSSDWQALESHVGTILGKRADIEALNGAAASIAGSATSALEISDALLDASGATAIIQEFQQRASSLANETQGIAGRDDPVAAAAAVSEHAAYLRDVANALGGEDSALDVRPLGEEAREALLVPLLGHISEIESGAEQLNTSANAAAGTAVALVALENTSAALMNGAFAAGGSPSPLPASLDNVWIPIGLVALSLILVILLLYLNSKSSVYETAAREQGDQNERNQQAILRLLDEMGSLADGDLTVEATVTEDITGTIADSFNYAIEELRKLVTTVNETAIMVESAAKQTEANAAHMAKAADNQTREISAATESIVSMAASIEEVSGNAERSSDVARHSVEVAHKGGEAVRRTIDGMNTIRETIQETSKRIKRLGESSQEIGNIVELINDIAEQTNILALNASIQASMAGEAGRGFAVVADEVQRLAERSTNATKQIEVLVSTIQADTKEAVVSMERSTTDVVGGALLAENAGAALDEIEQVSNQIASLVQNISSSAREQAGSAADVTRRTTRLSEISEQTGKATMATAQAISKLAEFASALRKSVAGFTLPQSAMPATTLQSTSRDATGAKKPQQASAG